MPEELLREIRKLEVRLEGFLKSIDAFVEELKRCIDKLKELNKNFEKLRKETIDSKEAKKSAELHFEVIKALSEVMRKESEIEHERSHLMESYGSLLLAVEKEFKEIPNRS